MEDDGTMQTIDKGGNCHIPKHGVAENNMKRKGAKYIT